MHCVFALILLQSIATVEHAVQAAVPNNAADIEGKPVKSMSA